MNDQLPHVTAFMGAPSTWGLLLRTIDTRPKEVTCIATSGQWIIAGCGNIVNIYDAVTGVLQQSLSSSKDVKKLQASPDGSTLYFAHSFSITMWDVQTGGLAYTFTVQSEVNDILLSTTGDYIACSFHNSVTLWNTRNRQEGKGLRNNLPIVAMCWTSPQELAVVTQRSLYTYSVTTGKTLANLFPDHMWGMVYFADKNEFLVGTFKPEAGTNQELCSFEIISCQDLKPLGMRLSKTHYEWPSHRKAHQEEQPSKHPGPLSHPMIVGKEIVCITPPSGVQSFSMESNDWTGKPPLLDAAVSVAISLNRNLVAQTKDNIQIFSADVLTNRDFQDHDHPRLSHVYPLGKEYIICLRVDRHLILLELETLQEVHPDDKILPFGLSPHDLPPFASPPQYPGVAFNPMKAIQLWRQGTSIPEGSEPIGEKKPRVLCALSPRRTAIITVAARFLQLTEANSEAVFAPLSVNSLGIGEVYDITFDSETRFHLKVGGLDQHFKVPYEIKHGAPSSLPPSQHRPSIHKGELEPLSEPRVTPYTLDVNCEWVLDAESRKICWISPGNLRRGDGGHFWIGTTLVMVGGDGVVRKVTFKEPDC